MIVEMIISPLVHRLLLCTLQYPLHPVVVMVVVVVVLEPRSSQSLLERRISETSTTPAIHSWLTSNHDDMLGRMCPTSPTYHTCPGKRVLSMLT